MPLSPRPGSPAGPPSGEPLAWDALSAKWHQLLPTVRVSYDVLDAAQKLVFKGDCLLAQPLRWGALFRSNRACEVKTPFTLKIILSVGSQYIFNSEESKRPHTIHADGFDRSGRMYSRISGSSLSQLTICISSSIISAIPPMAPSLFDSSSASASSSPSPAAASPKHSSSAAGSSSAPSPSPFLQQPAPASRLAPCPISSLPPLRLHQRVHEPGYMLSPSASSSPKDTEFLSVYGRYAIGVSIFSEDGTCYFEELIPDQYVSFLASPYLPTIAIDCSGFPRSLRAPWDGVSRLLADVVVFKANGALIWGAVSFLHATAHPLIAGLHTLAFIPEEDRSTLDVVVSTLAAVPVIHSCRVVIPPTKPSKNGTRSHSKLLDISLSSLKCRPVQPSGW